MGSTGSRGRLSLRAERRGGRSEGVDSSAGPDNEPDPFFSSSKGCDRSGAMGRSEQALRPTSTVAWWLLAASAVSDFAALLFFGSPGVRGRVGRGAGAKADALGPKASRPGILLSDTPVPLWSAMRRTLPPLVLISGVGSALSILSMASPSDDEHKLVDRLGIVVDLVGLGVAVAAEREASQVEGAGAALKHGPGATLWKSSTYLTVGSLAASLLPVGGRAPRVVAGVLGTAGSMALKAGIFEAGKASAINPHAPYQPQ